MGSAILLISCGGGAAAPEADNRPTMRSDTVTIYESDEGRLASKYYTPLMEKYGNAAEPYDEYKYGVEIIQYDTLGNVKSTFRANYAIHFTNLELWETKGDVVVTNEDGDRLETQQLFWNKKTKRVYSNVDTHFYREGGLLVRGESFESNEDLSDWEVRKARGKVLVDVEPTRDTTGVARDTLMQPSVMPAAAQQPAQQQSTQQRPTTQQPATRQSTTQRSATQQPAAWQQSVRNVTPDGMRDSAPPRIARDSIPPRDSRDTQRQRILPQKAKQEGEPLLNEEQDGTAPADSPRTDATKGETPRNSPQQVYTPRGNV